MLTQCSSREADVLQDRKKQMLKQWLQMNQKLLLEAHAISIDIWKPYINAAKETIKDVPSNICYDRFYVTSHLGKALVKVRTSEHRILSHAGDSSLIKTKQ